jgi:hypothetical protein
MTALFVFFSAAPSAASFQQPAQPSMLSPALPLSSFQRSLQPSLLILEFTLFNSARSLLSHSSTRSQQKKIFILGQLLLEATKQEENPFCRPCRPSIAYKRSRTHFRQKRSWNVLALFALLAHSSLPQETPQKYQRSAPLPPNGPKKDATVTPEA